MTTNLDLARDIIIDACSEIAAKLPEWAPTDEEIEELEFSIRDRLDGLRQRRSVRK